MRCPTADTCFSTTGGIFTVTIPTTTDYSSGYSD